MDCRAPKGIYDQRSAACLQFYKRLLLLIELVQALQLRHDEELQRAASDLFGLEKEEQAKHRLVL